MLVETVSILQTDYKYDDMGNIQLYQWFSRFKKGEFTIDEKPRSGRPPTFRDDENVETTKVLAVVLEDRRRPLK